MAVFFETDDEGKYALFFIQGKSEPGRIWAGFLFLKATDGDVNFRHIHSSIR